MDLKRISQTQLELLRKALIEYYSGINVDLISKRYGFSVIKLNTLSDVSVSNIEHAIFLIPFVNNKEIARQFHNITTLGRRYARPLKKS